MLRRVRSFTGSSFLFSWYNWRSDRKGWEISKRCCLMSEEFKVEIVNPEKSFFSKEDVTEVIVPAFEGEMGILKDHIPIISFLKPGIIKVLRQSEEESYFIEDGILEFKENNLSILTSSIIKVSDLSKEKIDKIISDSEKESSMEDLDDQKKFLIDQKIDILRSLN